MQADSNPYLNVGRIRATLRMLDLRPTRGMGQNFLIDSAALEAITNAATLTSTDVVIEVGPGLGVLTWELVRRSGPVIAVELDRRLAERLPAELNAPNLSVVQGDILNLAPATLLRSLSNSDSELPSYKLVANLPYAITAPTLRHFLEASHQPSMMVVLLQWEVAERICAQPGDLSLLAHSVQLYAEPEIMMRVPATSFFPAPQVDSAVLRLRIRPQPLVARPESDALFRTIKAGFLQTRKQLGNALTLGLRSLGTRIEQSEVVDALQATGIAPTRRAETLTFDEWLALHRKLNP